MEILWTGANSILRRNRKLLGYTSLWMFPLYGCVLFLEPLYRLIGVQPFLIRGLAYMICIFAFEFLMGWFLRDILKSCPWNYDGKRTSLYGLIRLSYAPAWFIAGLAFEYLYLQLSLMGI